jgi:hypothetical protein
LFLQTTIIGLEQGGRNEGMGISNLDVRSSLSILTVKKHLEGSAFRYLLMAGSDAMPLCLDVPSPASGEMLTKTFPTLGNMSSTCSCACLFSEPSP